MCQKRRGSRFPLPHFAPANNSFLLRCLLLLLRQHRLKSRTSRRKKSSNSPSQVIYNYEAPRAVHLFLHAWRRRGGGQILFDCCPMHVFTVYGDYLGVPQTGAFVQMTKGPFFHTWARGGDGGGIPPCMWSNLM